MFHLICTIVDKIWKRYFIASLVTLWATSAIWSFGYHIAFRLAGFVTSIILIIMAIIYGDDNK